MEIYASIPERVSAGLDWLTDNAPADWWDRIDLESLSIADGENCILGQVFAPDAAETGYFSGYAYAVNTFPIWDDLEHLGFCSSYTVWDEYQFLSDEWLEAITKLKMEVSA